MNRTVSSPPNPTASFPASILIACLRARTTLSPTCDCWLPGLSLDSWPVQNMGFWSVCELALMLELARSWPG